MAWGPISVGGSVSGYTLPTATASVLGGVKTGSNITNSGGTISITKANVTAALGYTPPTADALAGKAAASHTHDDRYYTEAEMDGKLAGKSNTGHTHNTIKDIGDGRTLSFAYSKDGLGYESYSWLAGWNGNELRPVHKSQFATAGHTHDDRYYTESEMNTKLNGKANSSHTHNYAGSGSAGGTANSVNGLTFAAQTTDPGAGSSLATNKVLIVYV